MHPNKLIIIGLDAADYQLTGDFMQNGDMPRLSSIRDRGSFSRLRSGIPPQTAPAWTSITTGVNPGKHGIYYFYDFSTTPLTITNATYSTTPRIWDYVQAVNGRSVVVNVPLTYPAHPVSGFMVSGIPPWYFDERSVYPTGLMDRLRSSGYEIDAPMSRGLERHPDELVSRLVATEARRVDLFLDLLKEGEWSFGMVVLTALDRLQHKVLGKGEKENAAVRRGYSEVDGLVGRIVDSVGGAVNLLVLSDHGFNRRPVAFYPNSWLYGEGLLKRKSSARYRLTMKAHDVLDGHLLWLPQSLTKRFQGATTVIHTIDAVDLGASRAFVPGTDGVMVVRSKEDESRIISGLSQLKDDSGEEICRVYTRDQVYKGERLASAPQLLIVPRDDVNIRTDPFSRSVTSRSGNFPRGNHGSNGIILAAGPDIAKSEGGDPCLEDVAPTSLALLGISAPDSMDGHAIKGILTADDNRPLEAADVVRDPGSYAFSKEDEKLVIDNLQRLGYT